MGRNRMTPDTASASFPVRLDVLERNRREDVRRMDGHEKEDRDAHAQHSSDLAVLKSQMSGVMRLLWLILTAVVGAVVIGVSRGMR